MELEPQIKTQFEEHAKATPKREACALLVIAKGKQRLVICENKSIADDFFQISSKDYAQADAMGEIVAVIHSHTDQHPLPSEADLAACEASRLTWWIYSVSYNAWHSFAPSGYKAPLIGRSYVFGVFDCYTLIRDWYRESLGVELPDVERQEDFFERGEDLYGMHWEPFGFAKVEGQLEPGDLVLMAVGSSIPNHGAIYLGDDIILHHVRDRLSSRDVYGGFWRKNFAYALRYKAR